MRRLALCATLAACAPVGGSPVGGGPAGDACGASGYRGLIGSPLAAVTLPAGLNARILGPDTAATTDFVPERLNLWVSRSGLIERVYCG